MLYRNWPEICKIVLEAPFLALEASTIELDSEMGQRLSTALPELFSNAEVQGPVPLSLIREGSLLALQKERYDDPLGRWEKKGAHSDFYDSLGIPVFMADINNAFENDDIPATFRPQVKEAQVLSQVDLGGRKFFILCKCEDYADLCPAECIAVDL